MISGSLLRGVGVSSATACYTRAAVCTMKDARAQDGREAQEATQNQGVTRMQRHGGRELGHDDGA